VARLDLYVNYKLQASMKLAEGETTIGRDHSCKVQIPDAKVSRMHAVIQPEGAGHEIENLGTNGTKVNGLRIENPKLLKPGDVIFISNYILAYQSDETPPESIAETLLD
jgi:pSer/pThr/pTyr-binding forkhead associated (FHA) protein